MASRISVQTVSRASIRILLVCAFIIAVITIVVPLIFAGVRSSEAWAAVAASLAVITSVFSSWSSQRVLELSEDAQKPCLSLSIDLKSRYKLMQLRVVNTGGSPAYDIRISWERPLLHPDGRIVYSSETSDAPDIPVLLPRESIDRLVGGASEMYQRFQDMNYSGEINFTDSSKRLHKEKFYISAESYRSALTYSQEELRTHYELQKIPGEIKKLTNEITSLRISLEEPNVIKTVD